MSYIFGTYSDAPRPYSFNGQAGWFAVPAGRNWYQMVDNNNQVWVSPNVLTKNADGTVSGSPKFSAELALDGTLVFQDLMAARKLNIDSPPHDRLSPLN